MSLAARPFLRYNDSTIVQVKKNSTAHGAPCSGHGPERHVAPSEEDFERAASFFRAAGDLPRLRLLHRLESGESSVSELASSCGASLSTISQQLRVLHGARLVRRRREGKRVLYTLADDHVQALITAALDHAREPIQRASPRHPRKPNP